MAVTTRPAQFTQWRFFVVYAVVLLVGAIFVARLFSLQIIHGAEYLAQTEENRTKIISDPPARGLIYDRHGIVLARNVPSYTITITPAELPDDAGNVQQIYAELSKLTGVPVGGPVTEETLNAAKFFAPCVPGPSISDLVALGESNAPYEPVKIQCNVDEKIARIVAERATDWPGVDVLVEPLRDYPTGSLTANIIGFLGPIPAALEQEYRDRGFLANRDKIGYAGIELALNDLLIGTPGRRVVEVDVAGQVLRNLEPPVAPVAGSNVVLTIDLRLQQAAEAALTTTIDYFNNVYYGYYRISSGVVIAMNPQTGEILAMAQTPTYENNRMARFIPAYYYRQLEQDPAHPLLNYAITAEFPPGSTFKLTTALGALNEGVVTPDSVIDAPAIIRVLNIYSPTEEGRYEEYYDWTFTFYGETSGLGKLPFLKCIALSSDSCFYKVGGGYLPEIPGGGLGIWRLQEYARALGYDQQTGIELPAEYTGLIPDPTWKRIFKGENWSTGDTYLASVGQGYVLATPLQVLVSAAILANDGKFMQPTIIREIQDNLGNVIQPFEPRLRWDITRDPVIRDYACDENGRCEFTGKMKTVSLSAVQQVQTGMLMATTDPRGTLNHDFSFRNYPIAVAGKTGTAEYCDDVANRKGLCKRGEWPSHGWTVAYAPFDNPEIAVLVFLYNAGEGGRVAAPIVRDVMDAYFALKAIDTAQQVSTTP
jgi:penicillin-binding protein 2